MYRLGPCIPIFRGFLLRVQEGRVYVIMLFLVLVLIRNVFLGLKKGISRLLHQVAQKHTTKFWVLYSWMH